MTVIKTSSCLFNILRSIYLIRFQLVPFHSAVINLLLLMAPLDQLLMMCWSGTRVKYALISVCKVEGRCESCHALYLFKAEAGSFLQGFVVHFRHINDKSYTHG